jgi:terminase small subunit-like protein
MTNVTDDGDGSSPALAIVEDQWVWRRRHCPRFTQTKQMLLRIGNGAKAAEAAGYAGKSAKVRARRLLRRPRVIAAIKCAQDSRDDTMPATSPCAAM